MIELARKLKILGDETRLRILALILAEELTVTELGEIIGLPQPRVSAHVAAMREILPLTERKEGRRSFLSLERGAPPVARLLEAIGPDLESGRLAERDREALERLRLRRRAEEGEAAGTLDLDARIVPGRSWEAFARALLAIVPRCRIADVGIGDGNLTLLLAGIAAELHVVDPDPGVLSRFLRKAERAGFTDRVHLHPSRAESMALADRSVDLVVMSQLLHELEDPALAIGEAHRVLDEGGTLLVLDLLTHEESWTREKLGHRHLGFREVELKEPLRDAGFVEVLASPAARELRPPRFTTLLALGRKPRSAPPRGSARREKEKSR